MPYCCLKQLCSKSLDNCHKVCQFLQNINKYQDILKYWCSSEWQITGLEKYCVRQIQEYLVGLSFWHLDRYI